MEPIVVSKVEEQKQLYFLTCGNEIDLLSLKNISKKIENDLREMDGVSQIKISGFPDEEIEISVDENKLSEFNINFNEIANAISNTNILISGGNIKTNEEEFLIRSNNKNYYANELDKIIIKKDENGRSVKIKDVAIVKDKFSETQKSSFVDFKSAVIISVSSTNSEDLIESAEKLINISMTLMKK